MGNKQHKWIHMNWKGVPPIMKNCFLCVLVSANTYKESPTSMSDTCQTLTLP